MSRRTTIIAVAAFLAMAAIVAFRTWKNACIPGYPHLPLAGFHDFRDVFYYPAAATLDGRNPYDASVYLAHYPVSRPLAPYAPTTLLLHLPLALLPFEVARWVHFALNLVLVLVLAWMSLREVGTRTTAAAAFGLGALILLARPTHMTLYIGQCTLYIVLGVYLALQYGRRRPWLAGLGLALACVKPTFGLPLALVMIVRRDFRALLVGGAMTAGALAVIGSALVRFAGGLDPLIGTFRESYARLLQDASVNPVSSVIRLDAVALLSRLVGHPVAGIGETLIALGVLLLGLYCVWAVDRTPADDRRLVSTTVASLMILTFSYHQAYDALLLALPAVALATAGAASAIARTFGRTTRWGLLLLMLVPAVNYGATDTVIDSLAIKGALWRAVTSANGAALMLAFVITAACVLRAVSRPRTAAVGAYTSGSVAS